MSSQNAENLEYVIDFSMESDEVTEKPGPVNPIEHHSNRQVWIPEDEVDDSPALNWAEVRPRSLFVVYRDK